MKTFIGEIAAKSYILFFMLICLSITIGQGQSFAQAPDIEECSTPHRAFGGADGGPSEVLDVIHVTESQPMAEVHVSMDISHEYIGDLYIELTHQGTSVVLHSYGGGSNDKINLTYWDAGQAHGTEDFDCECAMQPVGPGSMADFAGPDSSGDWSLSIIDSYPSLDDGVLESWCVQTFQNLPAPPPPPVGNLICNSPPGSGIAQLAWTNLLAYDSFQIFRDGLLVATLPGTASSYGGSSLSIPSIHEYSVIAYLNSVRSPIRHCTVVVNEQVDAQACSSPGALIHDLLPVISPIVVSNSFVIGDIQAEIDITHTYVGDLEIDLTSPSNTTVRLHDGSGAGSDDLRLTYWEFGEPNGSVASDCECFVQAEGPGSLFDFVGENSAGAWNIVIFDRFAEDGGSLNSWCLNFFQNEPTFPVQSLSCELAATAGVVELSWENIQDHDEVRVYKDGNLEVVIPGPIPAGSSSQFSMPPLSSPQHVEFCVVPVRNGVEGSQQCCAVDVELPPIQDLSATSLSGSGLVNLSWTNPIAYDQIDVFLDGQQVDSIPGTESSYSRFVGLGEPSREFCFVASLTSFGESVSVCRRILMLEAANIESCQYPGTAISDKLGVQEFIADVQEDQSVLGLELALDLSHTYIGDLTIDLTSPAGTTVRLHDRNLGSSDDLFLIYSDFGTPLGSMPSDCACLIHVPNTSLREFYLESSMGEWRLTVEDHAAQDEGVLNSWCLRVTESCSILPPSDVQCDSASGDVSLQWVNGGVYDNIQVLRDNMSIANLSGSAISYIDVAVNPGMHEYQIVGQRIGVSCNAPSLRCQATTGITDVIFAGEQAALVDSVGALKSSLEASGRVVLVCTELSLGNLQPQDSEVESLWMLLGSFPSNYALSEAEAFMLAELHTGDFGLDGSLEGTPMGLYLEGGDIWGFDPQTTLADYDGVENGEIDDGDDSLLSLSGRDSFYGLDLSAEEFTAPYTQDQAGIDYNDRLAAAVFQPDLGGARVGSFFQNGDPSDPYSVGLFYDSNIAPVISQSFEFGGYGGNHDELADLYSQALRGLLVPTNAEDDFVRGDYDGDGLVQISDVISTLAYLFSQVPGVPACSDSADANDDGMVGIADPIFLLGYLFAGGIEPPAPGPFQCGPDPTEDDQPVCSSSCP